MGTVEPDGTVPARHGGRAINYLAIAAAKLDVSRAIRTLAPTILLVPVDRELGPSANSIFSVVATGVVASNSYRAAELTRNERALSPEPILKTNALRRCDKILPMTACGETGRGGLTARSGISQDFGIGIASFVSSASGQSYSPNHWLRTQLARSASGSRSLGKSW